MNAPGAQPEVSANPGRPKVLYVMGGHRIGSTVLGVTLGNCADFVFAGEVHSWLTRSGVPAPGGEAVGAFWQAVAEKVKDAEPLFGHDTELYLDRSSALRRLNKWSLRRRLRPPYRRVNESLYRAIASAARANHIVDTSHYPLRARELQSIEGIDLYILFLVRDPQGVVASFDPRDVTSGSKPKLTTNLHLWATHLLSLIVFLRQPRGRRLFLRHEQFLADPENVVRSVLQLVDSPAATPDFTALRTGYPLQGNRFLRSTEVISLRGPSESQVRRSWFTALAQLPWAPVFRLLRPRVPDRRLADRPAEREQRVASGSG